MKTAIITGASAGLGVELLRAAIEFCPDIGTYWLIARRKDRLEALQTQFPERTLRAVPLNLTDRVSFEVLRNLLEAEKPEIALLINNAGMGKLCDFDTADADIHLTQVSLNCHALTAVTHCCLPYMHDAYQ